MTVVKQTPAFGERLMGQGSKIAAVHIRGANEVEGDVEQVQIVWIDTFGLWDWRRRPQEG